MSPRFKHRTGREEPATPGTIATVERALDLLHHLAVGARPDAGVTELAAELEMSKAAVHRVLGTLRSRGLVQLDPHTRRYSLGPTALRLGQVYLDRLDVPRLARPVLEELSHRTGETATLSVLLGRTERMYVDQVIPPREVIMSVTEGEGYPLHAGASGRAFLAFLPEGEREAYLGSEHLVGVTDRTVRDAGALRTLLEEVRHEGWAHSSGERKHDAAAVAAPVFGHDGRPLAVISVCGPSARFEEQVDDHRLRLVRAVSLLSEECGWTPSTRFPDQS